MNLTTMIPTSDQPLAWMATAPLNMEWDADDKAYICGSDLDDLMAATPHVQVLLNAAAELGMIMMPAYTPQGANPLLGLSNNGGDEDWIIVVPTEQVKGVRSSTISPDHAAFVAQRLAVCDYTTIRTPQWTMFITCHA
jgi:hypothetical protein